MSRIFFTMAVVVALLVALIPADAKAKKPTPFTIESCVASTTGHTISSPGTYRLSQSVSNCAASPIISIAASKVTLDLGGMQLDGDGTNCGKAIVVSVETHVTIENGTIRDCKFDGIDMSDATSSKVTGMTIRDTGSVGTGAAISLGSHNTMISNVLTNNRNWGIDADSSNLIEKNTVELNDDWAMFANASNKFIRNTFNNNGNDAMFVSGDSNLFKSNTASGNAGDGICTLGKFNVITGNTTIGNIDAGIHTQNDSNSISKNTAKGNGADGIIAGESGTTLVKNTSSGNIGSGIRIEDGHTAISNVTVTGNKTNGNGAAGIDLTDPLDTTKTTVKKNTANGNIGQGINVAGGTPSGAGTNKGSGNVTTPDCDANLC